MAIKKIQIIPPEGGYVDILHPETSADMVLDTATKVVMTPAERTKLSGIATGANNTSINNTLTSTSTTQALSANQGRVLKDNIDTHKVETTQQLEQLFQSVSNGKTLLETSIIDKGGVVSKSNEIATFEELSSGVNNIEVGDYKSGERIYPFNFAVPISLQTSFPTSGSGGLQYVALNSYIVDETSLYGAGYFSSYGFGRKNLETGNVIFQRNSSDYNSSQGYYHNTPADSDSLGNVYVASYYTSNSFIEVKRHTPSGGTTDLVKSQNTEWDNKTIIDILVDKSNNYKYILSKTYGKQKFQIRVYDANNVQSVAKEVGDFPSTVALLSDDNWMYILSNNTLTKFTKVTFEEVSSKTYPNPTFSTFSGKTHNSLINGHIYTKAGSYDVLKIRASDGEIIWKLTLEFVVRNVAVDKSETLFMARRENSLPKAYLYNSNSDFIGKIDLEDSTNSSPDYMLIDNRNNDKLMIKNKTGVNGNSCRIYHTGITLL